MHPLIKVCIGEYAEPKFESGLSKYAFSLASKKEPPRLYNKFEIKLLAIIDANTIIPITQMYIFVGMYLCHRK